jgi:hypothetical protein
MLTRCCSRWCLVSRRNWSFAHRRTRAHARAPGTPPTPYPTPQSTPHCHTPRPTAHFSYHSTQHLTPYCHTLRPFPRHHPQASYQQGGGYEQSGFGYPQRAGEQWPETRPTYPPAAYSPAQWASDGGGAASNAVSVGTTPDGRTQEGRRGAAGADGIPSDGGRGKVGKRRRLLRWQRNLRGRGTHAAESGGQLLLEDQGEEGQGEEGQGEEGQGEEFAEASPGKSPGPETLPAAVNGSATMGGSGAAGSASDHGMHLSTIALGLTVQSLLSRPQRAFLGRAGRSLLDGITRILIG